MLTKSTSIPATPPITIAIPGLTASQQAVIATSPPNTPLIVPSTEGIPLRK